MKNIKLNRFMLNRVSMSRLGNIDSLPVIVSAPLRIFSADFVAMDNGRFL